LPTGWMASAKQQPAKRQTAAMLAAEQAMRVPVRLAVFVAFLPVIYMVLYVAVHHPDLQTQLVVTTGVSVFGYFFTERTIPLAAPKLLPKLAGVDINKRGMGLPGDGEKVPESLGLVSGMVFLVCLVFLQVSGTPLCAWLVVDSDVQSHATWQLGAETRSHCRFAPGCLVLALHTAVVVCSAFPCPICRPAHL
jgi:hypothetical protein